MINENCLRYGHHASWCTTPDECAASRPHAPAEPQEPLDEKYFDTVLQALYCVPFKDQRIDDAIVALRRASVLASSTQAPKQVSATDFGLEPDMQPVVDELRRRMAAPAVALDALQQLAQETARIANDQRGADPLAGLPVSYFLHFSEQLEALVARLRASR